MHRFDPESSQMDSRLCGNDEDGAMCGTVMPVASESWAISAQIESFIRMSLQSVSIMPHIRRRGRRAPPFLVDD
jgi:hypothetical protein